MVRALALAGTAAAEAGTGLRRLRLAMDVQPVRLGDRI